MSFLDDIFLRLGSTPDADVLQDASSRSAVSGRQLLAEVEKARAFLRSKGFAKGERCALLAANSKEWVAADLAIMAEGLIVVPLYSRQAPAELVAMMKDCAPI